MEKLARVIGPAPSEMTLEELEEAVRKEHSRVARDLRVELELLRRSQRPRRSQVRQRALSRNLVCLLRRWRENWSY